MKRLWKLLGPNRGRFLAALLLDLSFCAVCVVATRVSGDLVDSVIASVSQSKKIILAFLILSLARVLLSICSFSTKEKLGVRQRSFLRTQAFSMFSNAGSKGREEIASFSSFLNNDIPNLVEHYFVGQIDILECMFLIAFSAVSLLTLHWLLALMIIGISVFIVWLPGFLRGKGGTAMKAYSQAMARYNILLGSFLNGLGILKTYRYRDRANEILGASDQAVARSEFGRLKWQVRIRSMTTSLQVLKTVLILSVGLALIYFEKLNVGGLLAVIQLAELIGSPIEMLAYLKHSRNEALPLADRLEEILQPPAQPEGDRRCGGAASALSVRHVSYQVNGLSILNDVSAEFHPGKKYMITGASGSGKSTLLRLISRAVDLPYQGEILLDQDEIRTVDCASYYRKICPVFQEPYLFFATLEENITLGRPIPDGLYQEVVSKLNLAYLLERYKGREITPELVEQLSGGERQRISLARAMVGKPEIYLLDEVTSALDQENAGQIERILLQEDAMVIHICHKINPALLSQYDVRYEMDHGKLSLAANRQNTACS